MAEGRDLRIIAADDDDINLIILKKILDNAGYKGICFGEGEETWHYLEEHPDEADLVILDKMMHSMSGLEIIKRMKAHPVLKDVPIIMQTGDASPERIKEGLDVGADRYITKPFSPDQLLEIVQEEAIKHAHMQDIRQ